MDNDPPSAPPEREIDERPYHVWHLPAGPVPWVTLALIAISIVATWLFATARDVAELTLYARGVVVLAYSITPAIGGVATADLSSSTPRVRLPTATSPWP